MYLLPHLAELPIEAEEDTTPTSQSNDTLDTEAAAGTTEADEGATVVTTQANIVPTDLSAKVDSEIPVAEDFLEGNDSSTFEPDTGSGLTPDTFIKSTFEAPNTAPLPTKSE